jgi:hypothetical protein
VLETRSILPWNTRAGYATTRISIASPTWTFGRSTSGRSAQTQTLLMSPMVNSSSEVPPEYWPATSMPGLTARAMTSPSMKLRSTYSCVTASTPPARNTDARCLARSYSAVARRYVSCAASNERCEVASSPSNFCSR